MSTTEVILLAFALAADAFTVGAAVGVRHHSPRQVFRLSFHFGLFQALMPLAGFAAGTLLVSLIAKWDHWIVLGVLGFIGVRMVAGGFGESDDPTASWDLTRGWHLIGLSVMVSIDALGAGVSLAAAHANLVSAALVIGIVAGFSTLVAMRLAHRVGRRMGKSIEIGGGLVLIGIGVKMVVESEGWFGF